MKQSGATQDYPPWPSNGPINLISAELCGAEGEIGLEILRIGKTEEDQGNSALYRWKVSLRDVFYVSGIGSSKTVVRHYKAPPDFRVNCDAGRWLEEYVSCSSFNGSSGNNSNGYMTNVMKNPVQNVAWRAWDRPRTEGHYRYWPALQLYSHLGHYIGLTWMPYTKGAHIVLWNSLTYLVPLIRRHLALTTHRTAWTCTCSTTVFYCQLLSKGSRD